MHHPQMSGAHDRLNGVHHVQMSGAHDQLRGAHDQLSGIRNPHCYGDALNGIRNPHCYGDAFGLGLMKISPDQMVTYSTVASAAVSGYHGYMSGGMQGAAIWGGAGAVVPQVFHRVAGMFMKPGVVTALIGCSIVPALAVSRGFARPSMGMGMGMGMF